MSDTYLIVKSLSDGLRQNLGALAFDAPLGGVIVRKADGSVTQFIATEFTDRARGVALQAAVHSLDGTAGGHIHIGPGVHAINAYLNLQATGHTVIRGHGIFSSTIQLIAPDAWSDWAWTSANGSYNVITNNYQGTASQGNITIRDLTVDANWQNLAVPWTNKVISAVILHGSNLLVKNVRVLNTHGDSASLLECFPIAVSCGNLDGQRNNVIEGCIVDLNRGDYSAGFCLFGGIDGGGVQHVLDGSAIRDCTALTHCESGAINTACVSNIEVCGNIIYGSGGYHHDVGTLDGLDYHHNRVLKSTGAQMYFATNLSHHPHKNIRIRENFFDVLHTHPGNTSMVYCTSVTGSESITDVEISRNRLRLDPASASSAGGSTLTAFAIGSAGQTGTLDGLLFDSNRVDQGFAFDASAWIIATHVVKRNNRDWQGGTVTGLIDT